MTTILTDNFETKLGTIQNWMESDNKNIRQSDNYTSATTGHYVLLQPFDLNHIRLPDGMEYETAKGWRWFIEKTNNQEEHLIIICKLINPSTDTEFDSNSGEYLDAIEIENKTHQLHIGTEDGEIMQHRAKVNDWMPERFKNEMSFYESFTEYVDFGFKTTIPKLVEGEKIYFHFIITTNLIKSSKDYPNERDISTWFAVDQSKKSLDEKLKKSDS